MKAAILVLSVLFASTNVFAEATQGCVNAAMGLAKVALNKQAAKVGYPESGQLNSKEEFQDFDQSQNKFEMSVKGYIEETTYLIKVEMPLLDCDAHTDQSEVSIEEIENN